MTADQEKEKRDTLAKEILIALLSNAKLRYHSYSGAYTEKLHLRLQEADNLVMPDDLAELSYKMADAMIAKSKS